MKSLLLCLFLIVMAFGFVRSQDPVFPNFPTLKYYSTYVSMNDFARGFTFAFKEYFSVPLNVSRIEAAEVYIIDWNNTKSYTWDSHFANVSSSTFSCKTSTNPLPFRPSYRALMEQNKTSIAYIGKETIDRQIECYKFQSLLSQPISIDYISNISFSLTNAKVDIISNQTLDPTCYNATLALINETTPSLLFCSFSIDDGSVSCKLTVYDTSSSETSKTCLMKNGTTSSIIQTFGTNTTAIIEEKGSKVVGNATVDITYYLNSTNINQPIRLTGQGNETQADGTLKEISFVYDWIDFIATDTQQIELYKFPSNCVPDTTPINNSSLPTQKTLLDHPTSLALDGAKFSALLEPIFDNVPGDSIIFRYDAVNNYQAIEIDTAVGDNITIFNDQAKESFSINTYTKKCIYNVKSNPLLDNPRSQMVYKILNGQTKGSLFTWSSTTVKRGVNVDKWVAAGLPLGDPNNPIYSYDAVIYTFNLGWKFPGRVGITPETVIPLGFEFTITDNQAQKTYHDVWDIFYYTIESIPNNYITMESMHCLPESPVNYNSLVYVNQGDTGSSYSYFERVDSSNNIIYSQGKFTGFSTFNLVDLNQALYSEWAPNATTCKNYNLPNLTASFEKKVHYYPSLDVFYSMAEEIGPVEYVGLVKDQIDILQFKSQFIGKQTRGGVAYDIERTAYLNWLPGKSIPHSVHIISNSVDPLNSDNNRAFNIYVYWSMFINNDTQLSQTSKPPATCSPADSDAPPPYQLNTQYKAPPLTETTARPAAPNLFTAYIEVKTIQKDGTYEITPFKWEYSQEKLVETFTIYNFNNYTPTTYKLCYQGQMGGNAKVLVNGKSNGIAGANSSPLYNGDGALLKFFYDSNYYNQAKLQLTYTMEKGVQAETYVLNGPNGTINTFMYYPNGWTTFGTTPTSRVPLTLIKNSTQTGIVEVWSFFRFENAVSPNILDNCALSPEEKIEGLPGGIIAAIVIVVAVCFIGISAIVFVIIRKRRVLKKQPPHILLDDRNLIHEQNEN